MKTRKGQSWNESEVYCDPITLRRVRRITTRGTFNNTPTYHTGTGWTADGEFLVFASARDGESALFRCHVPTGEITQLTDPFPGVGCLDELNKSAGAASGNGLGVTMLTCTASHSRWVVFVQNRSLRAVHLETLEERTLIENYGEGLIGGMPSVDPTEQYAVLPVMSAHPEVNAEIPVTKGYMDTFAVEGPELHILQVPVEGGSVEEIYTEKGIGCAHSPHCPADPNLLLIDRDFPPKLWGGSDGVHNRIWTLDVRSKVLTELKNRDARKFQVHSAWTFDGQAVVYHGQSALGGYYVGVTGKDGENIREYHFQGAAAYGHVSAMAQRPAIILDGNLTSDMLLLVDYDRDTPRIEMVARHGTNWGGAPWQNSHPHPQSDPTGRYISFNAADRGRSDVFVVEI